MIPNSIRRVGGALVAATLIAALAAAPAHARSVSSVTVADSVAVSAASGCTLSGGTMTWGVKESFRSYISGTIANGSWDATDGAEYEIPNFVWSNPTGEFDPATGTGTISFTGTIHFTGHDGVLDLTLSNPTIDFEGEGQASLMLDAKSNDMEGELVIDEQQVWVGAITAPESLAVEHDQLELAELPVTLTNDGTTAFAGFYEPDAALDPITLALEFSGCADTGAADADDSAVDAGEGEQQEAVVASVSGRVPWLPIGVGGAALLVIGFTVGLLVGTRRRVPRPFPQQQPPQDGLRD